MMEKYLQQSGDNVEPRFGLIGFGGERHEEAHIHTARGERLIRGDDFVAAINTIQYRNDNVKKLNIYDSIALGNLLFPWRQLASKNLILLTCGAENDKRDSRFDYSDIHAMLMDSGIVMHYVAPVEINSKRLSGEIFGVDIAEIYNERSLSQPSELSGEKRQSVKVEKSVFSELSQRSSGAVFTSNYADKKQWQSLIAKRIVKTALPDQCQQCYCVVDNDLLTSRVVCKPCKPHQPMY
jgi:hypothetical protein